MEGKMPAVRSPFGYQFSHNTSAAAAMRYDQDNIMEVDTMMDEDIPLTVSYYHDKQTTNIRNNNNNNNNKRNKKKKKKKKNKYGDSREKHKLDCLFIKRFFTCVKYALTSIREENETYHQNKLLRKWIHSVSWMNIIYVTLLFLFCLLEVFVGNRVMKQNSQFTKAIVDACLNNFTAEMIKQFITVLLITILWILTANIFKTTRMYTCEIMYVCWRNNLAWHLQKQYLSGNNYYKVNILDKRIDNPDQRITRDVEEFAKFLSSILEKAFQSPTNVIVYTYLTYKALGWQGPVICYGYFFFGSILNKILISPIVSLWFKQELVEGDYRFSHVTLRTSAESIAFLNGQENEKRISNNYLKKVVSNRWKIASKNFLLNFHTNLFGYIGAILNLLIISFAVFVLKNYAHGTESPGELIARIQFDSYGVITLVFGFTQFIQLGGDVSELAGYTSRIGDMIEVMDDIQRKQKQDEECRSNETTNFELIDDPHCIKFDNVSIFTPTIDGPGKCLVNGLSFTLSKGQHLLIHGPSGAGKSSILRLLCSLWSYKTGTITRPPKDQIMFIPQQSYIYKGSLRNQILYPQPKELKEESDDDVPFLLEILRLVRLEHVLSYAGYNWDKTCNWADILSPGEKQRLALARVFYHRPNFVIMDESTSSIDIDMEEIIYQNIQKINGGTVGIISIGHRPTLRQFHEYSLHLDGKGGYVFGFTMS